MLNIFNKINLDEIEEKEFFQKEVKENFVYLYFENNKLRAKTICKAQVMNSIKLKEVLDSLQDIPYLAKIKEELEGTNEENVTQFLSMQNFFGIQKKDADLISGNNALAGVSSVNTVNLSLLYMANGKEKELPSKLKTLFKKLETFKTENNLILEKSNYKFEIQLDNKQKYQDFLNSELDLDLDFPVQEKESYVLLLNIPGLKDVLDLNENKGEIKKYVDTLKIGELIEKEAVCKICLEKVDKVYDLRAFFAPNPEKRIRDFSLFNKTNQNGYMCEDCKNKVFKVKELTDNVYVDDISGKTERIQSISDFLTKNQKIGGTIYKLEKLDANAFFPVFVKDFELKTTIPMQEVLERMQFLKGLLIMDDIFSVYRRGKIYKAKDAGFKIRNNYVIDNFNVLKDFALNGVNLKEHHLQEIIKLHITFKRVLSDENFNFLNIGYQLEKFKKYIGVEMIEQTLLSINDKLDLFIRDDIALELNDEETVLLAGRLLRELDGLSMKKEKDLGVLKTVSKNNIAVSAKIQQLATRYSHSLYNDVKKTEIISKVLIGLNSAKLTKSRFELLFNIGFLNTSLKIIYRKGE